MHEGREYWFAMVTDDRPGGHWDFEPRVYLLHRLTDRQLAQAWEMHRSFVAAGIPGCLHVPPCPVTGPAGGDTVEALRARWPAELEEDYPKAPAVGWFRD